jgi:hypothetical protein
MVLEILSPAASDNRLFWLCLIKNTHNLFPLINGKMIYFAMLHAAPPLLFIHLKNNHIIKS